MGVIQRQGLKSTLVHLFSAVIGGVAVLFIYPLNDAYYGFAQWLYNTAFLLVPLASFGISSVVIKYFPVFSRTDGKNFNGFLTLIFSVLSVAYLAFLFFWLFFRDIILVGFEWLDMNPAAIVENEWAVLILLYFLILLFVLENHSANRLRIVVPNILQHLGFKIFLPVLILLSVHYGMTLSAFSYYIVMFFGVLVLLMILYLTHLGALRFAPVRRPDPSFSYRSMFTFGMFGSMNALSSSLAFRIDSVMIPFLENMLSNGHYNKILFISNVLEMPNRAINQIAAPIISKAWDEGNLDEIHTVYKKASTNLFLIGSFMFVLIWYVLNDMIAISADPDSFPFARQIFFYLALSKLFNMLTSVNSQIISYSESYKINLIFLLALAILNVVLNYIFILEYGIVGAAMATALSLFLFNLVKLLFIYYKYDMLPFTYATLKTLVLLVVLLFLYKWVVFPWHPLLALFVKATILSALFALIAYKWRISEDLNALADRFIKKKR